MWASNFHGFQALNHQKAHTLVGSLNVHFNPLSLAISSIESRNLQYLPNSPTSVAAKDGHKTCHKDWRYSSPPATTRTKPHLSWSGTEAVETPGVPAGLCRAATAALGRLTPGHLVTGGKISLYCSSHSSWRISLVSGHKPNTNELAPPSTLQVPEAL